MTKKHFVLIAKAIRECGLSSSAKLKVAERLAKELPVTNPQFNPERFVIACMTGETK